MIFFDAVVSGFKNCFVFRGRSSRSEFWWFILFYIMTCLIALSFSFEDLNKELSKSDININDVSSRLRIFSSSWLGIVFLITYVPQIALSVRRFHDINKSGWWFFVLQIVPSILPQVLSFIGTQALSFIGIITLFAYIYFMCEKGGDENQYGSNPLKNKEQL